jgi:hypothetical protein
LSYLKPSDLRWQQRAIIVFLSVVPILLIIALIMRKGVNLPYWDEWNNSLYIAAKTASGTLTLADLFRPNNEHLIVFTHLQTAALTVLTRWNLLVAMYFNLLVALGTFALLIDLVRRESWEMAWITAAPLSAMMFAMRQHENWLWAIQITFILILFWLVTAIWLIKTQPTNWKTVLLVSVISLFATYTFTIGLLMWPLLALLLWLRRDRDWRHYLYWAAAAVLTISLLVSGFRFTEESTSPNVLQALIYIPTFLGSPFMIFRADLAMIVGAVGMAIFAMNVVILRRRGHTWDELSVWVVLAAFAVGSAVLISLGRGGLDVQQALSSRYTIFSTPLWVAILMLGLRLTRDLHQTGSLTRWYKALIAINGACFAGMAVMWLVITLGIFIVRAPFVSAEGIACVRAYPQTHDASCMSDLYPARFGAAPLGTLWEHRLSLYADTP